jgi:aldehyde:ferredoxin oxidoreductase
MPHGWKGRILDVDLTAGATSTRDSTTYVRDYLGGRGLAARIACEEIPAGIDAFDPENRMIVATGPLTGTLAPTAGRTVMTSVSPRTYPKPWYTHSTLGGWFGPGIKYAGFDAMVIHGKASSPVYLEVQDGAARLVEASDLWGRTTWDTRVALTDSVGPGTEVLCIGPAGENLVRFASVQHGAENAAAHSGFGAVWGSKNLKAIAVRGHQGVSVADPDALIHEAMHMQGRSKHLSPMTAKPRSTCSQACTTFCGGDWHRSPSGRRVTGQCIGAMLLNSSGMHGSRYVGGGMYVPPFKNFGHAGEVLFHDACNGLGLDLWFRLVMQPWLIRCQQLGVREIRGYPINPKDTEWFQTFTRQLAFREGLGDLFAEDLRRAMDELEGEIPGELVRLGRELEFNFGFPAHREGRFWDSEPLPFWVISAMMHISATRDPTIGTHLSSLMLVDIVPRDSEVREQQLRIIGEKTWGDPEALLPTFDNKAPVAVWTQHQHMLLDSLTMCDFAFPHVVAPLSQDEKKTKPDITGDLDIDRRLLAAVTGMDRSRQELDVIAARIFNLERVMLARVGRGRPMEEGLASHFALPCRDDGTLLDGEGFADLMDEYYSARGWDLEFGWPQDDVLDSLGLGELIAEMEEHRRSARSVSLQ